MKESYMKARREGEKAVHRAIGEGRWPYLQSLAHILPEYTTLPKVPVGVMDIPLDRIVGTLTEGRENAFAWNFMPILKSGTEFEAKWSRLLEAQEKEGIHEAVIVYEYRNRFYVQEGNKRVSVLKYLGAWAVTADVRRILPRKTEEKDVQVYYEFLDFFQVTGLYDFVLTEKGAYGQLASLYGQNCEEPWPDEAKEALRADFHSFQRVYIAKGGRHLRITDGDAFLLYLRIYRDRQHLQEGDALIGKNIGLLWNELLSETEDSEAVLIEDEEAAGKGTGLIRNIQKLSQSQSYTPERPLAAVFIYGSDAAHSRWVYGHELGRNELMQRYEGAVATEHFDNCRTEEELDAAFAAAAEQEADVVFTTTAAMMDASMRAAIRYPKLRILNCSINLTSSAVRTYYPRMHEAKFMLGALAACYAEDHRIGYLADVPIYGSLARINAFALGAALVDPVACIILKWSGKKDCNWEKEMQEENLQIISGPDMIRPEDIRQTGGRNYGLYRVHADGQTDRLAAPIWNWGEYYDRIIRTVMDGGWKSREQVSPENTVSYWYGLHAGVIDVIHSGSISYYSEKMLDWLRDGIISGGLQPFSGELHSQKGVIQAAGAPSLSSEQIISMDWLNDNIIGEIPAISDLSDSVQEIMKRSGVGD